ncbi:MAG: hypothetical protein C0475_05145 [Planctomyces sp.]|nr:hypothetical protein [Planctomyces sp.]MBA4038816.1 hypothetical protein [Planctomyces sp.]MBA4119779.1 hypothetical protein [Isosphaera sp.]
MLTDTATVLIVAGVAASLTLSAGALVIMALVARATLRARRAARAAAPGPAAAPPHGQRPGLAVPLSPADRARLVQQQELINDMGAAKLRAETELLEIQSGIARRELSQRESAPEFQKLALEKLRLETDLLRLQAQRLRRLSDDERPFPE